MKKSINKKTKIVSVLIVALIVSMIHVNAVDLTPIEKWDGYGIGSDHGIGSYGSWESIETVAVSTAQTPYSGLQHIKVGSTANGDPTARLWYNLTVGHSVDEISMYWQANTANNNGDKRNTVTFYDSNNTRVLSVRFTNRELSGVDSWEYLDALGSWTVFADWTYSTDEIGWVNITWTGITNLFNYSFQGSVTDEYVLDSSNYTGVWNSHDVKRFTIVSQDDASSYYDDIRFYRLDLESQSTYECTCSADLVVFSCPQEPVLINSTWKIPYYVFGGDCSGATFTLKNSTYYTVSTVTRPEGVGKFSVTFPYTYGLGTWYLISEDCLTGDEWVNCSIDVVTDSGLDTYYLTTDSDVYSSGEYVSFSYKAPDGEFVEIRDNHPNYDYTITVEGTGDLETLNNVFKLTKAQQNLCFVIENATGVTVAGACIDVLDSYGYYTIKWEKQNDADNSGSLSTGDSIRIYGENGFSGSNDNVFLVAYKDENDPSIKQTWQMSNYGSDYSFDYVLTGSNTSNTNTLYLRMALKDYYTSDYSFIDDTVITINYKNYVESKTYAQLIDEYLSKDAQLIAGLLLIAGFTIAPLYINYEINKNNHVQNILGKVTEVPTWMIFIFSVMGYACGLYLELFDIYTIILFTLLYVGGIVYYIFSNTNKGE